MFGTGQITTTRLFPRSTQVIEVYDLERQDDSSCNPDQRYADIREPNRKEVLPITLKCQDRFQKTMILLRLH